MGVVFTNEAELIILPGHAPLISEFLKALFMLPAALIVRSVIKILTGLKDNASAQLERSRKSLGALEARRNAMRNASMNLDLSATEIQEFSGEFSNMVSNNASSFEQMSATVNELSSASTQAADSIRDQYNRIDELSNDSKTLNQLNGEISATAGRAGPAHVHGPGTRTAGDDGDGRPRAKSQADGIVVRQSPQRDFRL